MSLINDALKKAQKAIPSNPTSAVKPLQPVIASTGRPRWLLPSMVAMLVIILVAVAVCLVYWDRTNQRADLGNVHDSHDSPPSHPPPAATVIHPATSPSLPQVVVDAHPALAATTAQLPATPTLGVPAPPVALPTNSLPSLPKLQGIFYSSTDPSAILDGKTVYAGDQVRQYRVKIITKDSVTLVGPDKKEIQLNMEN